MKFNSSAILKIVSTTLFLLLIVGVVLIARNPAKGYELSIYSSLSPLTWVLLIIPIVGGIGIIIHQVTIRHEERGNWWQIGLLLVLLSNLIIVLLPYLKGYAFSCGGDHLSHLGYVNDILISGNIAASDIYPITHILVAQLSSTLNISPEMMMNFPGPVFYLLFVLFSYLLSKELLPKPAAILATTASTVLFCYYYNQVFPMGFAFITFPLIFYLYFKYLRSKSVSLAILLIVLVVLVVFFHPVASFLLTVALIVMGLSNPLVSRHYLSKAESGHSFLAQTQQVSLSLPLISFITLMLWIRQNYSVWNSAVTSVIGWFGSELFVKPMTEMALEAFNKLGLGIIGQLELFVKMYGHYFIYAVLIIIAIIMLARGKLNLSHTNRRSIALYSGLFLLVAVACLIDYVRPLTTLSSGRITHLLPALFPPLVGIALYRIGKTKRNEGEAPPESPRRFHKGKAWRTMAVGLILTICSLIGIFAIYPSPYTYRSYWGVSHAEVSGANWLLEQGDPSIKAVALGTAPLRRFAHALWGTQVTDYPREDRNEHVPDHFGYTDCQTLGESFEGDKYVRTRERYIEVLYTELYPQIGRFSRGDFAELERDSSVDKLYNNGEMQVWYVHGQTLVE